MITYIRQAPLAAKLAAVAAAASLVVVTTGPFSLIFTAILGLAAAALSAMNVGLRIAGIVLEAAVSLLGAFEGAQVIGSLANGETPGLIYFWFLGQAIFGLVVIGFAVASIPGAARATRWWGGAKWAAGLAFGTAVYWLLVDIADGLFSANLPTLRALMAKFLVVGFALIGVGMRSRTSRTRVGSGAAAGLALLFTAAYWAGNAAVLGFGTPFTAGPELGSAYATMLPWPVLMSAGVLLNAGVLAAWLGHEIRGLPRPAARVRG